MTETGKSSKARWVVAAVLIVVVGSLLVTFVIAARQARHAANRLCAYGRMCQMRLALHNYAHTYGTLPPLYLRDEQGKPIHSWRALVVPFVEIDALEQINLSEPWNSDHNRKIIENVPLREWTWFARDRSPSRSPAYTHIMALLGADSAWDVKTGLPKETNEFDPDLILLISVPESTIEPMQPGDITEGEVRKMVEDGKEILFIRDGGRHTYGVVMIEDGKLVFRNYQDVHD